MTAKDFTRPPPPRQNSELIGQEAAEKALCHAFRSGRMPHAWILTGPKGIGKATLAFRFARYVLLQSKPSAARLPEGADLFGQSGDAASSEELYVDSQDSVFHRVAAGGHADLLTVESGTDDEGKRILADDARPIADFLHRTAAEGGWRVVIVDAIDDLNRHAANALLKILEEPPARALLLLVSHAPGRILPTIRSRCRFLPLAPLAEDRLVALLARHDPDRDPAELRALARLAEGSLGRGFALMEEGGLEVFRDLLDFVVKTERGAGDALHGWMERLGQRGDRNAFATVSALLAWWLGRMVTHMAGRTIAAEGFILPEEAAIAGRFFPQRSARAWLEARDRIVELLRRADGFDLDRRQTAFAAFSALADAARAAARA